MNLASRIGTMVTAIGLAVLLACSALAGGPAAPAPASASGEVRWDMDSFARAVRPMTHDMAGRMPLVLWNFPIPRGAELAKLRDSGELRKYVDVMAARGVVPTVEMGWDWTPAGAMAMAKTLQEAGRPVHVLVPQVDILEANCYKACTVWGTGPDATRREQVRKWPCLPLADTSAGAEAVRKALLPYKQAGIAVSAVWFDDEALPHPWNGCFEAQKTSADCRKHYPPGVLDSFAAFQQYTGDLRSRLLADVLAKPVHALWPEAIVGNYGEYSSSKAHPFEGRWPPRTLPKQLALMPSAYANTRDLPRHFKKGQTPTRSQADRIYFHSLLRTVSSCNANKLPAQVSIPYLSRYVPDDPDPKFLLGMTQPAFRELVWHVWLRGADSIYVFNLGYPTRPQLVTPASSFESVQDVRCVLDALLAPRLREFLDKGVPMTFDLPPADGAMANGATPAAGDAQVIWSGLKLPGRCLIRTFTFAAKTRKLTLTPFEGVKVTLDCPPQGALYVVAPDGRVGKVP